VRVKKGEEKYKEKKIKFNSMIQTPKSKQHKTLKNTTYTKPKLSEHK
jgi:hypothetical protein